MRFWSRVPSLPRRSDTSEEYVFELEGISKIYHAAVDKVGLQDVSLTIRPGEFLAVMGPSGCGKSTLLNILGLIDSPTNGSYRFFGTDVAKFKEKQLTQLRKEKVGFVFQNFHLIDDLNVRENIDTALIYRDLPAPERRRRVDEAIDRLGLKEVARDLPEQLSGGEQQRVAIARALVSRPQLVLADEPTGNLDTKTGAKVMDLLIDLVKQGITVVMATHALVHANRADRTIELLDGAVVGEFPQPKLSAG
jgi:putative ABC transport system ATP-binding protein